MSATAQQVQKLREMTGAGILDCKKALDTSGGDYDKAVQFLREKGKASAAQKASRTASEGLVGSWIAQDAKKGSLVELNCETDFVARTAEFQDTVRALAAHVAENSVKNVETLLSQNLKGSKDTIESYIKEKVGKLGENLKVKRAVCYGENGGWVSNYIHQPVNASADCGRLGVLLEVTAPKNGPELQDLLKELSMQVAAANPKWVSKESVPADIIEKEKAIYLEQCKQSGKPEAAWPKILEGKLKDFLKQFCLVEQNHIRDSSGKTPVQALLDQAGQKLGGTVQVKSFVRYKVGEE